MGRGKKKVHPKTRTAAFKASEPSEVVEAPHSFIIHRGLSCPYITDLTIDVRRIMEPFTATNLREKKMNRIKDFVSLSSFFHVSHMGIFNKASTQLSFKVVRLPRGPSLTFKVHQFTLARDVISSSKKQMIDVDHFKHAPLVIMNNFSGDGKHLKLMATTFQNMFPSINLAQVNIDTIRRCVLFSYNSETKLVEMRHYSVQVVPVGLKKAVNKIVVGTVPNLGKCNEVADFVTRDGYASESEAEDEQSHVVLAQTLKSKGNLEDHKSSVKLHEIGPRLTMQLIKIEEGLLTGEVLYHDNVIKSEEEKEVLRKLIEKKRKLKEQRKKQQTENRARNLKLKKEQKELGGIRGEGFEEDADDAAAAASDVDDDAQYYKDEVGEEPDEELFKNDNNGSRKRFKLPGSIKYKNKRPKVDPTDAKKSSKSKKNYK
ncbi:LOW QUALITY PROTEIN: protein Peter pan [Drosophila sulfurigaster albostrigata]|uniref:LOW QUALITY PROTEIN: protein Peter pan n=1 Tax=Drosophila sulfurigaster albostrigata TaxID=89887 RepID=UPI002D21D08F|nr:LOW QUALITY PROTEIN: protein Peter pan [Drosophila sulfurigaster albostrigata]